jgi:hypothetical protein
MENLGIKHESIAQIAIFMIIKYFRPETNSINQVNILQLPD